MIDYASVPNISGAFPNVVGLNSTGPGVLDGTPYLKSIIDDLWGFNQALLNKAFQTPTGVTESDTVSQRLDAIQKIAGGPGEVVPWMGNAADPSSIDVRLLPLNGQVVLRTTYPELDDICYVGDPDNPTASAFYRTNASDTVRSTSGTHLKLPDLRGLFIRGLDIGEAHDPEGSGRDIGDLQTTGVARHEHQVEDSLVSPIYSEPQWVYPSSQPSTVGRLNAQNTTVTAFPVVASDTNLTSAVATVTSECRPVNSAARWCIRF